MKRKRITKQAISNTKRGVPMKYIKLITLLILVFATSNTLLAQKSKTNIPLRTWKNKEERINERQQIQRWKSNWDEYMSKKQKISTNLLKSTLFPGIGQSSCKAWLKGSLFFSSTVVSFGSAGYFLFQSNENYEKYKVADNIDDIEKYWDKSIRLLRYSQICASIGAGIWLTNIVDAYVTTKSYNKALFNHFYYGTSSTKSSLQMGFNSKGVNVALIWRF